MKQRNRQGAGRLETDSLVRRQFEENVAAMKAFIAPLKLEDMPGATLADMNARAMACKEWKKEPVWRARKRLCNLWAAAFLVNRHFLVLRVLPDGATPRDTVPFGITLKPLPDYARRARRSRDGHTVAGVPAADETRLYEAVDEAARECQFFHLKAMFPGVAAGGGCNVILSNLPWERVKLQEQERFAAHGCPDIVAAPGAATRRFRLRPGLRN